ncbi:MAG: cell envelope integrity protein CreD [Pontiellaceae bacterium]|nr:cell envelope integrity protein CreD [Pontiellaceae bacterium]
MQLKIFFKLAVLGGVSILLLIALISIGGITGERKQRFREVQGDIERSYAGPQQITGQMVFIRYRETWLVKKYNKEKKEWEEEEVSEIKSARVYPEELLYDGSLTVQERYRGIFKAQTFQSKGTLSGIFKLPVIETLRNEKNSTLDVLSAEVGLCISDPRGISQIPKFVWNDVPLEVLPGSGFAKHPDGLHAVIPYTVSASGQKCQFSMDLNLHGTGQFTLVPVGFNNRIRLNSAWPHPEFSGDFLATERTVSDRGFTAEWNVNALACSAQQNLESSRRSDIQYLGVNLIDPVNVYSMTDSALKYGFLFIFITFAAFFLFEIIRQLNIHPIQYGFVGLAQALFFLLLLSLSEHIGFTQAYLVAAAATVGTISIYLCSVLKGLKRGVVFGGCLSTIYGALYGLLKSEDHALVAGSALLFILLALTMIITRKIDWYAIGRKTS